MTFSGRPMTRPMPNTMGTGFGLNLPFTRTPEERAVEGLERKSKSVIHEFGEIQVLNGRYGPYIKSGKNNYKIPKDVEPEGLDEASCKKIIEDAPPKGSRRGKNKVSKDETTKKIAEKSSPKGSTGDKYPQKFEQQV